MLRVDAAVEIEVAGVGFIVQGLTVVQTRREIRVDLPTYQRDGRQRPAFCLPDELMEPIGRIVLERAQGDPGYAGSRSGAAREGLGCRRVPLFSAVGGMRPGMAYEALAFGCD